MRLTPRLVLAQAAAISVVLAVQGALELRREVLLFEQDMARDDRLLAANLANRILASGGAEAAPAIAAGASQRDTLHVQWRPAEPGVADNEGEVSFTRWDTATWLGVVLSSSQAPRSFRLSYAVRQRGLRLGTLVLEEPIDETSAYLRASLARSLLTTLMVLLTLGTVSAVTIVSLVGRPTRRLVEQAQRIGGGDLSPVPVARRRDEISELSQEMNRMAGRLRDARQRLEREAAERIRALEALRRADRLATVGQLASGLAHELGTPMNVVCAHAEMIAEGEVEGERVKQGARAIGEHMQRMVRLVRQLLDFARPRQPNRELHELQAVVAHTLLLLLPVAQKRGVELELRGESARLPIDESQLEQVVTNLVVNAVQATARGGTVRVQLEVRSARGRGEDADRPYAVIRVLDTGAGIAPADLPRIFDPFFTTKPVGLGTGLGLSIVHAIVREHGGWIEVESELGAGTELAVFLPFEARAESPAEERPGPAAPLEVRT